MVTIHQFGYLVISKGISSLILTVLVNIFIINELSVSLFSEIFKESTSRQLCVSLADI